jgi:predicted nucleic acid-binding protein
MPEPIIADTSSLIALERINLLQILCKIYKEVIIPESVIKEFGNLSLSCLSIRKVESNLLKLLITDLNLGKGEADVIALASQTGLKVIIDDSKARRVAENMGLKVTGTIGILIKAERAGLIGSAHDKVRELREKGFYVSEELLEDISKFKKVT